MQHQDSTSVYSQENNYSLVNSNADYHTLKHYYTTTRCPPNSLPGTCMVRPVYITPAFGGTGYDIPGFNSNTTNMPLNDSNYFNLTQAYPQACAKVPFLTNPTYS